MFAFSVPFCAGKQRPRFSKGHAYKTTKEGLHEEAIALAFEEAGGMSAPKGVPVSVRIEACMANKKREGDPFTSKPDADNIAKLVLDALNGRAWHDDAQVVNLTVGKLVYTKEISRIRVEVGWKED